MIFRGTFIDADIGLAIKNGAVLDDSEILNNHRFGVSISNIIFILNIVLSPITAIFISIEGFEYYVGLTIVFELTKEIEHGLINEVGTGITIYRSAKGHGNRGTQEHTGII